MIKKLCNDIMKLSSYDLIEKDYSIICFLYFIKDYRIYEHKYIDKDLFCKYLYRFYLDNEGLKNKHFYKLINNLQKYSPMDLFPYCNDILNYIENKSQIIWSTDKKIGLSTTIIAPSDNDINIINQVIDLATKKTLGYSFSYTEKLTTEDFLNYKTSPKLFNRLIENINYCFICEEDNIDKLTVIKLKNSNLNCISFDINNYLLLCKKDAELYEKGCLIIKKNGYAYFNDIRIYNHLEISVLKKIRKYLTDI